MLLMLIWCLVGVGVQFVSGVSWLGLLCLISGLGFGFCCMICRGVWLG